MERVKIKKRGTFKKGQVANPNGRPKGSQNKTTKLLKDAIIEAAELEGMDTRGKEGLVGRLRALSRQEPKAFASLLGRVLPYHIVAKMEHEHRVLRSKEEVQQELKERGIPVHSIYGVDQEGTRTKH